ncbi:MAG: DUF1287 domain-containing protein [Pseudomonadales bacterium]
MAFAETRELAAPGAQLAAAALDRTTERVRYDGSYRPIDYPGGDVPVDLGVCSDLVIRAYPTPGVDLQRRVHEDMHTAFAAYPLHGHYRYLPKGSAL